jgi:hypothetical protein
MVAVETLPKQVQCLASRLLFASRAATAFRARPVRCSGVMVSRERSPPDLTALRALFSKIFRLRRGRSIAPFGGFQRPIDREVNSFLHRRSLRGQNHPSTHPRGPLKSPTMLGGLGVEETAEVLKVSSITVMRDWSTAKAWLYRELAHGINNGFRTVETGR